MSRTTSSNHRALVLLLVVVLSSLLGFTPQASARAGLAAPTGLSPDAESVTGIPMLSWDKVTSAKTYNIELYRLSDMTRVYSATTVQTHVVPTRQLPSGEVMWRVRAMSGASSSAWAEATLDHSSLAGPSLVGPEPGALLSQPDEPVVLNWTPVSGATEYTVEVSTDSSFTDTQLTKTTKVSTTALVIQNASVAQPYYWRVRATLASDLVTEWSDVGNYEVGGLSKPVLTSPEDGPFTDVEDVVLDWEPVPGAKAYNLQVSTDQNFSVGTLLVDQKTVVGSRYSPPITLDNDQYYWRVQPIDNAGNVLDWSSVDTWTFRRHWPEQPSLTFPAEGDVVGNPFYFQWTPVAHASRYTVLLSQDPSFPSGTGTARCSTTNTTFVPKIKSDCWPTSGATYYWMVLGYDDPEGVVTDGIAAEVNQFTYLPDTPTQLSPANGDTVVIPTLSWAPVQGAAQYRVTVTPTNGGTTVPVATTTATTYTPRTELSAGKTYRWDVQALSDSGRLGQGRLLQDQDTFTVEEAPTPTATTPEPTGPPAGTESSRFPTLTWDEVVDATQYKILVRREGTLSWQTLTDKFVYPAGEDDTTSFLQAGTYEWMVQAFQGSSQLLSVSQSTSTFVITPLDGVTGQRVALGGQAAGDPSQSCPTTLPDRCMDLRQTPVMAWDPVPDIGMYRVWIARDEEMTNIVQGPIIVEGTQYTPADPLADSQAGSAYYWYVQACRSDETTCAPLEHASHAFNKLSKPIETVSPAADETFANDITFTWRDYLETNQDPTASPSTDPTGVSSVDPTNEARQYRIQVSPDANFQTLVENSVVDQTTFTSFLSTYPEGPLYWRVQAIDGKSSLTGSNFNNLAWSAPVKFFKHSPTTTLLAPIDDNEVTGSFPLRWTPVNYAAEYDVEIYKNADTTGSPTNRVLNDSSLAPAASLVNPLPVSSVPYTWRIRPVDAKGRPGAWTDLSDPTARFYVTGSAPTPLTPSPDTYIPAANNLFNWSAADGAATYQFERRKVGTTAATETIRTPALGWAPYLTITDGVWEWRVSSLDAKGKILGSSPWQKFKVDSGPPTVVVKTPTGKSVSPKANFIITFSEPVTGVTTSTYTIRVAGTTTKLLAKVTMNAARTKATLNPVADLKSKKKYTIKVTKAVLDMADNPLKTTQWSVTVK